MSEPRAISYGTQNSPINRVLSELAKAAPLRSSTGTRSTFQRLGGRYLRTQQERGIGRAQGL
jgi:hypothetical protein